METVSATKFKFAEFELDAVKRTIFRDGAAVALNPKAFDLLLVLIERRGEIVSRDELLERVWANQFVEENNLSVHVSGLRKALGERRGERQFIVTVPGKGYSFVHELDEPETEVVFESHKFQRIVIEESEEAASETAEVSRESRVESRESVGEIADSGKSILRSPAPPAARRRHAVWLAAGAAILILAAAAIWQSGRRSGDAPKSAKLTRLTASGEVLNIGLAPDGKFFVFAQTEPGGQSLWLRQTETGSQTRIVGPKPVDYLGLTVTPDSNYVYASVLPENKVDGVIWKIPLLGGAWQEFPVSTGTAVSFSPDGRRMAFIKSKSALNENHLVVSDADGGGGRVLFRMPGARGSFPNFKVNSVAWSPDGAEIACPVEEETDGETSATVRLFDAQTGAEKTLTGKRWAFAYHLAWTAGGENLAVVALEKNARLNQIWLVSRSTGAARQLTNDTNHYDHIAAARDAPAVITVQRNTVSTLQVADLPEPEAESFAPRVVLTESRFLGAARWTRAGEILYVSGATGVNEIWRVAPDGASPAQLTAGAHVEIGASLSPDNSKIVFSSWRGSRMTIWTADADGKNMRPLLDGAQDVYPNFAGDEAVIFQRGLNNKSLTLWRVAAGGGEPIQLTHTNTTHPAVSPDGARVAYYFMEAEKGQEALWRVGVIDAQTGAFRQKIELPKFVTERRMRWHPGGEHVAQIYYADETAGCLLLPTTAGGGSKIIKGFGKGDVSSFDFSPDGRKIAFTLNTNTRDVVSLTDF